MKSKCASYGLGVAALALLVSASASAATLARQRGAFGIVTYDVPIVIESVADWDALLAAYKESDEYKDALGRWNALALHLNEVFPGLAAGDEQVIVMSEVVKLGESDPNVEFGWYVLANYRKSENGKNLTLVSAGGAVELITYEKQEDGTFKVASAITALDGSSMFESMVKGMCDRYGVTYEDYISAMKWQEFNEVSFLLEFMSDHPEYERIEYKGAMVTAKELDEMQNKMYEETAAALEAETGAAQ